MRKHSSQNTMQRHDNYVVIFWRENKKIALTSVLETGQDGKGLLRIHLWCPDDLPRLWNGIEYRTSVRSRVRESLASQLV